MTTDNQRTFLPSLPQFACFHDYIVDGYTHTHTHAYIDTQSLYILMALTFLSFFSSISFYFILFWVSFGSQLFVYLAVSSHFIFFNFFPSLFSFYKLITLREIIRWGKRRAQRKKNIEWRIPSRACHYCTRYTLSLASLSLSFLYLFIYIFFYFSLFFMSFRLPSSLYLFFCFVRSIFIYISGSFPAAYTQTQHTTTALNDL